MMYVSLRHTTKIILCQIMETITLGESTWEPETQHAAQLNLLSPPPTPAVAKLRGEAVWGKDEKETYPIKFWPLICQET